MTPWVRLPALIGGIAAPLISFFGQLIAILNFPAYNPFAQTISELAAGDAPTQVWMTGVFCATGAASLLVAFYAPIITKAGRMFIFLSGLSFFGVAAFPLETMAASSGVGHRVSAIVGFILLAAWPLVSIRRDRSYPWVVRPVGAISATLVMAAFCFWFLGVWADTGSGYVGTAERIAAGLEGIWPMIVVIVVWRAQRRRATAA
jgi:hypothetical membrane protein